MKYFLNILTAIYLGLILFISLYFWLSLYPATGKDSGFLIAGIAAISWFILAGGLVLRFLGKNIYDIQAHGSIVIVKALSGIFRILPSDVTNLKRTRPQGWIRICFNNNGKPKKLYYQPRFSSSKYVTPSAEELKRIFPFAQTTK